MNKIKFFAGKFPLARPRRLRANPMLRNLARETRLSPGQFVMPYFVRAGKKAREAVDSMPGQFRFSIDTLLRELGNLKKAGISSILLFGIPGTKDEKASSACSGTGIVQKAVREIKKEFKGDLLVITDVCLCAYTSHGHCGILRRGKVDNDASIEALARAALSHAEAGADMVAPSDMMDGRVRKIRETLDGQNFENIPIMSYAAKYASAFYGPFRDAACSAPGFGDRKSYQMDPANLEEALREIRMDIEEGADIVMVKPALAYLDVIREAARTFKFPLAAYSVSGEYAMVKAATAKGFLNEKETVLEMMTSITRAGARILITYHAKEIASWLK